MLLGVAIPIFFMLRVVPGDIIELKLRGDGGTVSAEVVQQERERLGLNKPLPVQFAWGLMLSGSSSDFYREAPWMIVFPGFAISLSVFAFNLFGDSLHDWLDPKFKT